MIRIKDQIYNENEIKYIMQFTEKELQVMFKNNDDIYVEATFDDIEWNYQEIDNIKRVTKAKEDAYQRIEELEKRIILINK